MAAFYGQSLGRASLDNGSRASNRSRLDQFSLPDGACSYRDLNAGINAPSCGCRRFWLNNANPASQCNERAWCFCGHHACFHDHALPHGSANAGALGDNLDADFAHCSQSQAPQSNQQPGFIAPTWSELIREPADQHVTPGAEVRSSNPSAPQSQSINTRLWDALNGFARQQQDGRNSRNTSNLPSTAVPSIDERRSSPTRTLQQSITQAHLSRPPLDIPYSQFAVNRTDQYSATEVATPSVHGTPDLRVIGAPEQNPSTPENHTTHQSTLSAAAIPGLARHNVSPRSDPVQARPITAGPSLSIQEMCNTIQDLARRIHTLESVSFTNVSSDQLQNQLELVDGRLLDLEHWRVDQDKSHDADDTRERLETLDDRLSDLESRLEQEEARREEDSESPEASASMGMRGMIPDARSFDSDGSFDMDAAAQTEAIVLATIAANAETGPRIDALESRISQLENASAPTHDRPWSVEVVLLPFGRQLPGIWFSAADSTRHSLRSQTCESWASQRGTPGLSFKSSGTGDTWTTESIEAWAHDTEDEWLSPKACGPTGTVFQRLVSRGLVRDIELRAPDAGHILQTISDAFDNVLPAEEHTTPELVAKFHGLRERYVPLRKIRKSSRLRFLSGAEMVTPATWTANFLEASVFMKANGDRRLYLTTPAGYIQAPSLGWTWPALRSLPMYDVDGELQAAQAVGDIVEACWSYNERLDHAASLHSSFASDDSPCWIISKGNCQVDDDDDADEDGRSSTAQQKWLRRSVSFPNSVSAQLVGPETQSKRRVTSFDVGPTSHDTEYSAECILKRRRLSSSPEIERRGFGLTPRYSREPPSPYPSADVGMVRSSQAASSRGRGTTPFAYATPHSHLEYRDNGDTDVDDSVPAIHSDAGDDAEEWEGMQDAPPSSPVVPKHGRRDNNVDAEEDIEDDYPDDDDEG